MGFLSYWRNEYLQFTYDRRVMEVFFAWLDAQGDTDVVVEFSLPTLSGRWHIGEKGRTRYFDTTSTPHFIVGSTPHTPYTDQPSQHLFSSPFLLVTELRQPARTPRLRDGLTTPERELACAYVRRHLESYLSGTPAEPLPSPPPPKFNEPATVDVVLWVAGELRGSIICSRPSLSAALEAAAERSARDDRFRPLARAELHTLHIEIVIISQLQFPLPPPTLWPPYLLTEKGYSVVAGTSSGTYLPTVYHTTTFTDYEDFLRRLVTEKAHSNPAVVPTVQIYLFEVESFMQNGHTSTLFSTRSGLIQPPTNNPPSLPEITAMAAAANTWLASIQDVSGFIPKEVDPYQQQLRGIDYVRMAFCAQALATYGNIRNDALATQTARTLAHYIRSEKDKGHAGENELLMTAYLCRFDHATGDTSPSAEVLERGLATGSTDVLTELQLIAALLEKNPAPLTNNTLTQRAQAIYTQWHTKQVRGEELSLAEYAELVPILYTLMDKTGHENDKLTGAYHTLCRWYKTLQHQDGSFPNTTKRPSPYARGTSKIFEALAVDGTNDSACLLATQWLRTLQYRNDNLFFGVPEGFRALLCGSFMNSPSNHRAWIDTAGHVLIGVARLTHP